MLESQTLSIAVARDWRSVYEAIWRPEDFPGWASGLSRSGLRPESGGWWQAQGPEGPIRIRFTAHNDFGVMDHGVEANGAQVYVPMRVIANGAGAEVLFTLFRQPGMTDEKFAADAEWVRRDLAALKALLGG